MPDCEGYIRHEHLGSCKRCGRSEAAHSSAPDPTPAVAPASVASAKAKPAPSSARFGLTRGGGK